MNGKAVTQTEEFRNRMERSVPQTTVQLCIYFQANAWAQSKQLPGQFTGTTDVRILSQQELAGPDKRNQAWAKKVGVVRAAVHTAGSLPPPVCLASGTAGQLVFALVGSVFSDLTERSRLKELEDMGDAHCSFKF